MKKLNKPCWSSKMNKIEEPIWNWTLKMKKLKEHHYSWNSFKVEMKRFKKPLETESHSNPNMKNMKNLKNIDGWNWNEDSIFLIFLVI